MALEIARPEISGLPFNNNFYNIMLRRKFDADLHNKIGKMFAQGDKIWWEIMCHKDWNLMTACERQPSSSIIKIQ